MNDSIHPRPSSRHAGRARRAAAFTLVELLVVIGIIALLISILLPALGAAQRSGRAIKCTSSLRQIGTAFHMYAIENKGWWPAAVHGQGSTNPRYKLNTALEEYRWPDQLAKYITSATTAKYDEVNANGLRTNSVLWGCPEWAKNFEANDASFGDRVRVGYGMNPYPTGFATAADKNTIDASGGRYFKQTEWTKPTDRGLIIDDVYHIMNYGTGATTPPTLPTPITSATTFFPFQNGETSVTFWVDGLRHAPSGTTRAKAYNTPYMNMLFCDGHVTTVSVKQAWNAMANPGDSRAQ